MVFFRAREGGRPEVSAAAVFLFAVILAAYGNVMAQGFSFAPIYALYTDISNAYWVPALSDKDLFPRDPWVAFMRTRFGPGCAEWPWVTVTRLFAWVRPCTAGFKFLSVLLCGVAALLVRRWARKSVPAADVVPFIFTAYFLTMDTFYGLPRIYGLVVFLAFCLALEEKRLLLLPAFPVLAMLFYPSIGVGLFLSALVAPFFCRERFKERRHIALYGVALLAAAAVCLAIQRRSIFLRGLVHNLRSGGFYSDKLEQFVSAPLDPADPWDSLLHFVLNLNEHGDFYTLATCLLAGVCAASALWARKFPRVLPKALAPMLCGSAAAFFLLYRWHPVSAARQTVFIIPLVLVFLSADALQRLRPAVVAAAAGAFFISLHPVFNYIQDCSEYRPAYGYLSNLPSGSVVAGYPSSLLLTTIPVFAAKTAYLSDTHIDLHIFLTGADEFQKARGELLAALYSADSGPVLGLAKARGIDYLVLESEFYSARFLGRVRDSKFSCDRALAALLKTSPDVLGLYRFALKHAAFSWRKNGQETLILDLRQLSPAGADGNEL
ncbi:MAG TPA: hypothetical protein DCP85_11490 [Elusimicrobia bacterium]|nr:hypothetical protein [Elusimicrobiota bacterium]